MRENGMERVLRDADVSNFKTSWLNLQFPGPKYGQRYSLHYRIVFDSLTITHLLLCAARESSRTHEKYFTENVRPVTETNPALTELRNDLATAKEEIRHLTTVQVELQVSSTIENP